MNNLTELYTALLPAIHKRIEGADILILGAAGDVGTDITIELLTVGNPKSLTLLDVNYGALEELGKAIHNINESVEITYILADAHDYTQSTRDYFDYTFNCAAIPEPLGGHDKTIHHMYKVNILTPYYISENAITRHLYQPVGYIHDRVTECILEHADTCTVHCSDSAPELALISMFTTSAGTVLIQTPSKILERALYSARNGTRGILNLLKRPYVKHSRLLREIASMGIELGKGADNEG